VLKGEKAYGSQSPVTSKICSLKDVRGRSPLLRGLWKRAKGYGRIKPGRVSGLGGTPRKTSETGGEILKVREGGPNP
jgi:hypothetical protein